MNTNEFVELLNTTFGHGDRLYYSTPENPDRRILFAEVVQNLTRPQLIDVGTTWTRGKINYQVIAIEPNPDMQHPENIFYSVRVVAANKIKLLVLMAEQMYHLGLTKKPNISIEWKVDKPALPWDGFTV